jgi:Domain of unknown function (DUF222)/HNH endonuclease
VSVVPAGLSDLRSAAAALAAVDPSGLPPAALAEAVAELRRLIDGLEGTWSGLLAALDGSAALDGGTAAWLRSACRLSPATARSRVSMARRLAERPAVGAELSAGAISVDHARVLTAALDELAAVDPGLAAATEDPLLAAAGRLDPSRLRREIGQARRALVPEAAELADRLDHQRRHLDVAATFDDTVAVNGLLDPEGGELLLTALAALSSRSGPDDQRSPGQRRADALVELSRRQLDHGDLPSLGGERPHLTVLVPVTALTAEPAASGRASCGLGAPTHTAGRTSAGGVDRCPTNRCPTNPAGNPPPTAGFDRMTPAGTGTRPGSDDDTDPVGPALSDNVRRPAVEMLAAETVWGAVLSRPTARRLACDASITRVVLDPDSQPLAVGRRTRTIPPAIRTALIVRDRGCTHPGCDRGPQWTDAHHLTHWADGGTTSLDNLILLCRQHHRAIHQQHPAIPHAPPRAA